ncbi:hypothetical protein [Streptomyces sp. NPDC003032]
MRRSGYGGCPFQAHVDHEELADVARYLLAQLHPATTPMAAAIEASHRPHHPYEGDHVCLAWTHRWLANAAPRRTEPVLRAGHRLLRRAVFPDR